MKLKNAPGRKQKRRQGALDRLVSKWQNDKRCPDRARWEMARLRELLALGDMRGVRTKKRR